MAILDLEKYEHMDIKKLFKALMSLEEKQIRLEKNVEENRKLVEYVRNKFDNMKNNPPKQEEYLTSDKIKTFQIYRKWANENPEKREELVNSICEELGVCK